MQISCLWTKLCCFHRFSNIETLTKLASFSINTIYANTLIQASYILTLKPLKRLISSLLTWFMLIDQLRRPWPFTWHDLITSHITWPGLWMFKGPLRNMTPWPWPDLVTYFYTSAYKRQYTVQISRPCTGICSFRIFFNFETITKLPSFSINIIYANRSINGSLTYHLAWPHDVTHPVTSIMDVQMDHAKFDHVTLTWPGDPLLHICLQKGVYSANITSMHWIILFSQIFQLWNPYKTAFIQY